MKFEKIKYLVPLLSTPGYKKTVVLPLKTQQTLLKVYLKTRTAFKKELILDFFLILWCIISASYKDEIHKFEEPFLLRIYNSNWKDSSGFLFRLIQIYVDFDLSNLLFLVLSYAFLNKSHVTGYMFTIKVILINNCKSILQLMFRENRPFWEINYFMIQSNTCFRTFASPDTSLFCTLAFCYFSLNFLRQNLKSHLFGIKCVIIAVNLLMAISFIADGQIYISQVISTYVYFILIERVLGNAYKGIEKIVEGLLLYKQTSRRNRRTILMLVFFAIVFNLLVNEVSVNQRSTSVLRNYKSCLKKNNMELPTMSRDRWTGSFPSLLASEDPFAFLGLYLGVLLVSVNIKDISFWYNLSSKLRMLRHFLFGFIIVLAAWMNWFLLGNEKMLYELGMNLRYFLYTFWIGVYILIFGILYLLVYYLHEKETSGSKITLSRLHWKDHIII